MPAYDTAEDLIQSIRERFQVRAHFGSLYDDIHNLLPEKLRIRLMGPMDEAHELARAVAALDVALEALKKPPEPHKDEPPTGRNTS